MTLGPRIYNLFPLLVGSVQDWSGHLARIAGMQFDWVFLNPIHYPGFSGSLYAVKDPYRLHARFQGGASESPDDLIRGFCGRAEQHGMRVMLDLVVNHTAKDSVLAEQHPEWFRHRADGTIRFAENPPKTTMCTAPMRAQASIATAASTIIGR